MAPFPFFFSPANFMSRHLADIQVPPRWLNQIDCWFCPRTSTALLSDKMKSWVVPDGDGGTSENIRLGQEAAFCRGLGGTGSDIQGLNKTMDGPHPLLQPTYSRSQNTCPVYAGAEEEVRRSGKAPGDSTIASRELESRQAGCWQ